MDEGALPRTKITTYYRFDGTGNWNNKTETYRRVPGLYEMNIAANELFDHEYVEFYVAADNRYHRTTTQVYRVNIQKLSSLIDGIRTNITDGQQVRSTVTATANDGGDDANSKILLDGVELPVGKVLENGAYYSFATAGRDSYFHNALTLADDNLTDDSKMERIASLLKCRTTAWTALRCPSTVTISPTMQPATATRSDCASGPVLTPAASMTS